MVLGLAESLAQANLKLGHILVEDDVSAKMAHTKSVLLLITAVCFSAPFVVLARH